MHDHAWHLKGRQKPKSRRSKKHEEDSRAVGIISQPPNFGTQRPSEATTSNGVYPSRIASTSTVGTSPQNRQPFGTIPSQIEVHGNPYGRIHSVQQMTATVLEQLAPRSQSMPNSTQSTTASGYYHQNYGEAAGHGRTRDMNMFGSGRAEFQNTQSDLFFQPSSTHAVSQHRPDEGGGGSWDFQQASEGNSSVANNDPRRAISHIGIDPMNDQQRTGSDQTDAANEHNATTDRPTFVFPWDSRQMPRNNSARESSGGIDPLCCQQTFEANTPQNQQMSSGDAGKIPEGREDAEPNLRDPTNASLDSEYRTMLFQHDRGQQLLYMLFHLPMNQNHAEWLRSHAGQGQGQEMEWNASQRSGRYIRGRWEGNQWDETPTQLLSY